MLTVFWDKGLITLDFKSKGKIVNSENYRELLTVVRQDIRDKR